MVGIWQGGIWIYSAIFLSIFIYPLLEMFGSFASKNIGKFPPSNAPNFIARLTAISILLMVTAVVLYLPHGTFTVMEQLILIYSCGLTTGIVGIVLGHELFHRKVWIDRQLGAVLMLIANYPHFRLQHLYSHHPNVASESDHSTSMRGESIYHFYWKSIVCGGLSVVRKESSRSVLRAGHPLHPIYNRALGVWLIQACIYLTIYFTVGPTALGIFIAQGVTSILVLETVNYIQHYGLERSGSRVNYASSWDNYALTNFALFNLGFHSDHHVNPNKPFYALEQRDAAPVMPHGYFTMAAIALIPPFWRWMMDERSYDAKHQPGLSR
ncbi:MAG: fatty acid desaturase [bacterium]|nr:fatty acid desaturase [bacterium]